MICPPDLRKRYHEGRLIPFVGAGVSMSVTWHRNGEEKMGPSWGELVEYAARDLGFEDLRLARVRGTDLQILEYFKILNAGQTAKLTNWLARFMDPSDDELKSSSIHKELASLTECNLFYTTNFDDFLERAFQLHGLFPKVVAVESQMGGTNLDCEIIKFHGDLNHPDHIVLTESDYEKRLALSKPMDHRLRADLLGRVILFIGYSFRDPNVSYLFRLFSDQLAGQSGSLPGDRAYIVVPDPSDFELQLFRARGMYVIPVRGVSVAEDISQLLREIRS